MEFKIKSEHCLACSGTLQMLSDGSIPSDRTAHAQNSACAVRILLPRQLGTVRAVLSMQEDRDHSVVQIPLTWMGLQGTEDIYEGVLPTDGVGLKYLRPELETAFGRIYGKKCGFGGAMCFTSKEQDSPFSFQFSVYKEVYDAPAWIYGGVIYHIFVDRFYRGGNNPVRSDAVFNPDWENGHPEYPKYPGAFLRNNEFFGGDLQGVCEKLPYIASLGTKCIYLSPIFRAYSNHKYDTGDYMEIDSMFGGEAAFRRLLEEAEKYDIRVILDGVFNHTGADSRYFNKFGTYDSVGAYQSKDSPYAAWFDFQSHPDTYTAWWGIDILPRIHPEVPSCRDYFLAEDGVIAHYAKMGIGGMRLDVVDELKDDFVAGIKARLAEQRKDAILYGEVWEDASNKIAYDERKQYYNGRELDGVMNYPLRTGLIQYVREGNVGALEYAVREVMMHCPKRVQDAQMNLLGTHDTIRILTALAAPSAEGKSNAELVQYKMPQELYETAVRRLQLAYLALATLPGVPAIFYGDEVGMQGYSDPMNRKPYPWHAQDQALLSFYQTVGRIRTAHAVYRTGEFSILRLDAELFAFVRTDEKEQILTVINRSASDYALKMDKGSQLLLGNKLQKGKLWIPSESGCLVSLPRSAQKICLQRSN